MNVDYPEDVEWTRSSWFPTITNVDYQEPVGGYLCRFDYSPLLLFPVCVCVCVCLLPFWSVEYFHGWCYICSMWLGIITISCFHSHKINHWWASIEMFICEVADCFTFLSHWLYHLQMLRSARLATPIMFGSFWNTLKDKVLKYPAQFL